MFLSEQEGLSQLGPNLADQLCPNWQVQLEAAFKYSGTVHAVWASDNTASY